MRREALAESVEKDMKLNELRDNPGAVTKRMRVGRGVGSGKGKTAGRGVKGQKARDGVSINGFEGGQMPLYMRLPKRGFNPPNQARYVEVDFDRIERAVASGKLDPKKPIDEDALVASGVIRRKRDGVRLLANGELKTKITLTVTGASKAAAAAVEKAGGSITLLKTAVEAAAD
jgi:large subunit ribosomal protein L15